VKATSSLRARLRPRICSEKRCLLPRPTGITKHAPGDARLLVPTRMQCACWFRRCIRPRRYLRHRRWCSAARGRAFPV
jgi:hypothetical protein